MSRNFKLNDPVTIDHTTTSPTAKVTINSTLQGIVAFLGPVSFADGDDWVGVRLTGDSIGKGKNDGSVRGVRYFDRCGPNGGVFVRRSALKPRTLNRLEELRLKREIKGSGATSASKGRSSSGGNSTSSSSRKSPRPSHRSKPPSLESLNEDEESVHSVHSVNSLLSASSTRSRLDEIRQRRLALASRSSSKPSKPPSEVSPKNDKTPTSPTAATTGSEVAKSRSPITPKHSNSAKSTTDSNESASSSSTAELGKMQEKIDILNRLNQSKEEENNSLQKSLRDAEQQIREAIFAKEEAQNALALANSELNEALNQPPHEPTPPTETQDISRLEQELLETKQQLSNVTDVLKDTTKENSNLKSTLTERQSQLTNLTDEMDQIQATLTAERSSHTTALTAMQTTVSTLERELTSTTQQAARRDESNALQYKEKAKLQAEIAAWTRRVEEAKKEKLGLETELEELTLDKEGVEEKLEGLEERLEEVMIDAESAQIEVDELRLELEEARERAEIAEAKLASGTGGSNATATGEDGVAADRDDVTQALSIQNSRLREAIVRLREQSSVEKMELTRQLRAAEKASSLTASLESELSTLRASDSKLRNEVRELKEVVDQGTAFEKMVEDLSDTVMGLEDGNVALQVLVRELEEGAELNGEMEEAQNEEIRALMEEVQNRETIILNLEEAIKMQRRRELDFQRTVKNYKTSNERLNSEKDALLALQTSSDNNQSNVISVSQKALSHAAQMVSTAAYARKKDAEASFHYVDSQYFCYLAERLENLLPTSVSSVQGGDADWDVARMEVMGVKGELLLSKVALKASLGLRGVGDQFVEVLRKAKAVLNTKGQNATSTMISTEGIPISENLSQHMSTLVHETKFAQLVIGLSSECLKLMAMGQWPDLLTEDGSLDFGNSVVHLMAPLDGAISELLFTFKEEGSLSPHRSNLTILDQAIKNILSSLSDLSDSGVKMDWSPPGLALFEKMSSAKFFCLGAGSLLASIYTDCDDADLKSSSTSVANTEAIIGNAVLSCALTRIDQMIVDINDRTASEILAGLNVMDLEVIENIDRVASEWKCLSEELFKSVEGFCCWSEQKLVGEKMAECASMVDKTAQSLAKLMTLLRASRTLTMEDTINEEKEGGDNAKYKNHPLSPETKDPWGGITKLVRKIRSSNGDVDDLNYLIRARNVEQKLSNAVANDAKLSIAETRIASLEKTVSIRSKEIGMQNSRLAELEVLLAQASIVPSPRTAVNKASREVIPSDEVHNLKEEIRVLSEAMEVLQTQVDEYEREIRSLKESQQHRSSKSSRGSHSRKSINNNSNFDADFSLAKLGLGSPHQFKTTNQQNMLPSTMLSLEASLFRPALKAISTERSMWKSKAIDDVLLKLPPLRIRSKQTPKTNSDDYNFQSDSTNTFDDLAGLRRKLILASAEVRRVKAGVSIIDLDIKKGGDINVTKSMTRRRKRQFYNDRKDGTSMAMMRLEEASSTARHALARLRVGNVETMISQGHDISNDDKRRILGRVTFPREGKEENTGKVVPFTVQKKDIIELHSILLQ